MSTPRAVFRQSIFADVVTRGFAAGYGNANFSEIGIFGASTRPVLALDAGDIGGRGPGQFRQKRRYCRTMAANGPGRVLRRPGPPGGRTWQAGHIDGRNGNDDVAKRKRKTENAPAAMPSAVDVEPPRVAIKPADLELVRQAAARQAAGKSPTQSQSNAMRRVAKAREENQRWQYYRTIPKRHWVEMSGRQHKVILAQAERLNFPMLAAGRDVIDLVAFVRRFHAFIAEHAHKLSGDPTSEDPMLATLSNSPALERYRTASAALKELELKERNAALIPREHVHAGFAELARVLRQAGEQLKRHFGPDAHEILDEALADAADKIEALLSGAQPDNGSNGNGPGN